jgi:TetR/AcrR family transcriptional regulator
LISPTLPTHSTTDQAGADDAGPMCPIAAAINALTPRLPGVRQRRKAARPHELLEAALTLFVEKGLAATRAEEVAKLAGVSKGTLYLYYPSKDALFKAVIQAYLTQVIVEGGEIVDQFDGSTSDLLHILAHTWWTRVGASKASGLLVLIMAEAHKFPELAQFYMDEVVAPSHALLARAVQRGIERGEFRAMDVTSVVHALIAPVQFLILYRQCASVCAVNPVPLDPERFMSTQIELLLRGLEVRPATQVTDAS